MKSREQTAIEAQCQQALRQAGKSYPRTCAACKLGPCKFTAITPPAQGSIDADGCGERSCYYFGKPVPSHCAECNGPADRAARQSAAPEMTDANQICQVPPDGWYCTRAAAHNGPCAAHPHEPDRELDADDYASIAQAVASIKSAPSEPVAKVMQAIMDAPKNIAARATLTPKGNMAPSEPVPHGVAEVLQLREVVRASASDLARLHAAFGFPEDQAIDVDDMIAALNATPTATSGREAVTDEPVWWLEADESARNADPRDILGKNSMLYSTRFSMNKPTGNNPYWPMYFHPAPATSATKSPDANVEKNRELLLQRSMVGLAKYGVTTADNPIPHKEWLQHALEESLDMANYLQAAINRPEPDTVAARKAALHEAATLCNAKFMARGDTGHAREASTARSLRDEILDLINKEGEQ